MLKIMFVDDEINVRNGLRKSFDWDALGFEVVAEAEDGVQALERFHETLPDVVITDICMAKKDGLDFIAELKAIDPRVEVIILSGYPDFNYAKAAMESEAFAYLLKPLKSSEFLTALENLKAKIHRTRGQAPERFLFKLLQITSPTREAVDALCVKYSLTLPMGSYFVAAVQIDDPDNEREHEIYEKLCESFSDRVSGHYNIFVCQPQHRHIALLSFCESQHIQTVVCALLNEIKEEFSRQYAVTFTMGISPLFQDITSVRDAYMQALFAVSQKALYGYGCTIHYSEDTDRLNGKDLSTSLFITSAELDNILTGIKTLNQPLTENSLRAYFSRVEHLKNANVDMLKSAIAELAMQVIHSSAADSETARVIFGDIPLPVADISHMDLVADMQRYIQQLIHKIFAHADIRVSDTFSKPVRDAQIFIMLNYPLPISIDTIAEELHIDRYHLMRMFKNETGTTINDFITKYRISVAIDLLKSGNYRIAEISLNVGYRDSNYFSKVFKKQTGYLPSDYPFSKEE